MAKVLSPSSGTGQFVEKAAKCIRFVRLGCTNRPFFHVVVSETRNEQFEPPIEQLGTYDPLPNVHNEKLVSLNFDRIRYWIGKGADVSDPVRELLGLSGFYPVHPRSYIKAWRSRRAATTEQTKTEPESSNIL